MRTALVLVCLCSTAAAAPPRVTDPTGAGPRQAPVATLAKDVDGDNSPDKIELDASGELRIDTQKGSSKVALSVKPSRATLGAALVRGTPTIVVQTGDTGIAVQRTGSGWKQVVKTSIGGVGLDADYSVALDANDDGIYRYQTRPGHRRCDGKPGYLFAERFEGGKFVPLAKLPTGVPANAPVIAARVDQAAGTEPLVFKARFASHQPGAPDAGALAIPQELDDGRPGTVWREELSSAGEGQWVTYIARMPSSNLTVRLVPAKTKGVTNRVQRVGVVTAHGAWHIDIPDSAKDAAFIADVPTPVTDCITLVIESTYGAPNGTTGIAELEVFGDGERSGGGEAMFAQTVAAGGDGAKSAAQTLARRGAAGVAAIDTELGKTTDAGARSRLVLALVDNRDPLAGPVLARAIDDGWVQGPELVLAIKALAGLGQGQALHDVAARKDMPLDARVAAVRALQPTVEKERDMLVALAGRGPRELRQAVIEQLTDVPVATLAPLAQAQPTPVAAGDLWRAVTRRAHATPSERAPALAALTAALPTANDYERRYRIVDGIAAVGDAVALRALGERLAGWPQDAETSAFKQVAARAIAVNPRADALDLILALVDDADPGVRLAALSAIAGTGGGNAGTWHGPAGIDGIDRVIQTRLLTDTWPEVRRYSAQVLGGRCSRPGPASSLADSVARDPDVGVRGDALAALVECKAPSAPALLAKLWDDRKAPLELRQRAVDLSVTLGDRALAQKLVAKYTQWRGAALESKAALALVQNAAYAIGRLNAPGAANALADALDDNAFPEIVSSAATGLGLLGRACPANMRLKLKALATSDDQQVQLAASRAAEVCGK